MQGTLAQETWVQFPACVILNELYLPDLLFLLRSTSQSMVGKPEIFLNCTPFPQSSNQLPNSEFYLLNISQIHAFFPLLTAAILI